MCLFFIVATLYPIAVPAQTPFIINEGHAGAWFNAETPGQGQLIDVRTEDNFVFVSWFTFTEDDSDNPREQHWFTAQGNFEGNSATLVLYETLGGRFDNPQEVSTAPVGTMNLTFADCESGTLNYTIDTWGNQGSFAISRAIPGSDNVCQAIISGSKESLGSNDGWDGAWLDPINPGQGFLIDTNPNSAGD